MGKYRRTIILINKRFQIRFATYVCAWLAALCFVYPLIIQNLFEYFIRYAANDPMGPELSGLMKTKREVLTLLTLTEIAFLLMTFLVCIFISHRIAGPLYKIRQAFGQVGKGVWKGDLRFRKKDYFPELADDFNQMIIGMRERMRKNDEILTVAISRVEAAGKNASEEVRRELEPVLNALRKMQQDASPKNEATASPVAAEPVS